MDKIRIVLVEDHVLVREGTKDMLNRQPDFQVVAEAGDGEEAINLVSELCPDIVIMDIELPKINGIEATKRIKASNPTISVLVLTAYDNDQYIFALLEAGAAGYLLKDASTSELIQTIRAVYAGELVLHPIVARKVINYFAKHTSGVRAKESEEPDPLTEREMDVLKLASKGMTNREISQNLVISIRTVQVHLSNIFGKLKVGSRTEAVLHALRKGWLKLEDTIRETTRDTLG